MLLGHVGPSSSSTLEEFKLYTWGGGGWYDPVGTGMTLRLIMVPSPFDVQNPNHTLT